MKITTRTMTARQHLQAASDLEGNSALGLLLEAFLKGSDLRFDMRADDVDQVEEYVATIGDRAYALEAELHTEFLGWTQS